MLVVNSVMNAGITRATLHGRPYLVGSAVLLVPGILDGSAGKVLYRDTVVNSWISSWNGMPAVVYHPKYGDKHVTARDPVILETVQVGNVYRAQTVDNKLAAQVWVDEELAYKVDDRIPKAMLSKKPLEVSTGIDPVELKQEAGIYNGKDYDAELISYRPDHLAILPDQVGACSIRDGCGLVLNQSGMLESYDNLSIDNLEYSSDGQYKIHNKTYSDLRASLQRELTTKFKPKGIKPSLSDITDDHVIFLADGKRWKIPYKLDENEVAAIQSDEPIEVRKRTEFVDIPSEPPSPPSPPEPPKEPTVNKEQLVNYIITNCSCWKESDKDKLTNMEQPTLEGIKAQIDKSNESTNDKPKETPPPEKINNQQANQGFQMPKTADEWLEVLPPSIQEVITEGRKAQVKEKSKLVNKLLANASDEKKQELTPVYMEKPLGELEQLVSLLAPGNGEDQFLRNLFEGRGSINNGTNGSSAGATNNDDDDGIYTYDEPVDTLANCRRN